MKNGDKQGDQNQSPAEQVSPANQVSSANLTLTKAADSKTKQDSRQPTENSTQEPVVATASPSGTKEGVSTVVNDTQNKPVNKEVAKGIL